MIWCGFIHSTLNFFKNYDSIEHIDTIYLDGDILELPHIIDILKSRLEFDNIVLTHIYLQLGDYRGVGSVVGYLADDELLKTSTVSLEGLRYNDGKQEYIFIDNTLVIQKRLTKEQKRRIINLNRIIESKKGLKATSSSDAKSNEEKSILKMDMGELFLFLKDKFSGKTSSTEIVEDGESERGKILLLIVLIFGMGAYYFGAILMIWRMV